MGNKPKLALYESDLIPQTLVEDGSHQISKVKFVENNQSKLGYYKKLAPNKDYPGLLGKGSVFVSFIKRMFQDKAAEERLVYNDKDEITGTLSFALEGFKPLNFTTDPVPEKGVDRKQVIPDTETLLEENIIEMLFGRWFLIDDDVHPHNISLKGDIDHDMFLYWLFALIKGYRIGIGRTGIRPDRDVRDYETFPILKVAKPFHWPTFDHPGENSIPTVLPLVQDKILENTLVKLYPEPAQFRNLASKPKAHEQKFAAALKILLTYQPKMYKARLKDLFGDLTLDFTSLKEKLPEAYQKEFPELFTMETNKQSFVDFMMKIYHMHYDNIYRVVVFYKGCEDNGYGVKLPSTYNALYSKPSYFKNIQEWAKKRNETLYKNDDESKQFNLDEMAQRYHQFYRNSLATSFRDVLHDVHSLLSSLVSKVSDNKKLQEIEGLNVTDDKVDDAWAIFSSFPDLSFDKLKEWFIVDEKHSSREAIGLISEFTSKLYSCSKKYYCIETEKLEIQHNSDFITELNHLTAYYEARVLKKLGNKITEANDFSHVCTQLRQLARQADFDLHLASNDEQKKDLPVQEIKVLPIDDKKSLERFCSTFFGWAYTLDKDVFAGYITEIVDKKYCNSWSLTRERAQPVKDYLARSKSVPNDQRLAYILCSGKELGELNRLLIENLIPLSSETYSIHAIRESINQGTFSSYLNMHVKAAVTYTKEASQFKHVYRPDVKKLFCTGFFDYLKRIEFKQFDLIIKEALVEYKSQKWWSSTDRSPEVKQILVNHKNNNELCVAMTLGAKDGSTCNEKIFKFLIQYIQQDLIKNEELLKQDKYRLLLELDFNDTDSHTTKNRSDLLSWLQLQSNEIVMRHALKHEKRGELEKTI